MPSTPTPDLTCLFVSTGIPYASSHCRLHNWIDHQEGLFANGLSMLVIWCILADIQLTSIWTHGGPLFLRSPKTLKNKRSHHSSAFIHIGPNSTRAMIFQYTYPKFLQNQNGCSELWGFECLKDIKIKRFLTMTCRGNSAKNLTSVARDPARFDVLFATALTLLGISYKVPQPATRDPDCFPGLENLDVMHPLAIGTSVNATTEKCKAVDPSTLKESASKRIRMATISIPTLRALRRVQSSCLHEFEFHRKLVRPIPQEVLHSEIR
ncbi:hypothetical protein BS47DRAFT_1370094 [Hydnum rufescens UP504]|uniref:Uncharacterized protein n=1 Tax=Hydnum rufescens UP504 TaxID=1448309 RepID=A0A9P6AAA6_9AGAM|nr:hypothetical protein BS47DRAFT_1370094 [Hydnum rufescens UP504]